MTRIPGLSIATNERNGFCVVRLNYMADPERSKPENVAQAKRSYAPEQWRREQEIDFTAGHGIPAFGNAFTVEHIIRGDWEAPDVPKVYRGWDWGFNHPAFVAGYFDDERRFCVMLESMGSQVMARTFIQRCKMLSRGYFSRPGENGRDVELPYVDYADWSGDQRSDKSPKTTMDIARGEGVYPIVKKMQRKPGFDLMHDLLKRMIKGKPALMIHESCSMLIRGFQGEYSLDPSTDLPEKDEYFEHVFDALRYVLCGANVRPPYVPRSQRPRLSRMRPQISDITGY